MISTESLYKERSLYNYRFYKKIEGKDFEIIIN